MTRPTPEEITRLDPRDLIGEAYRMKGLAPEDCRAIFFDWALGWKQPDADQATVRALLDHYGPGRETHPMTAVLEEGLNAAATARRRGGRKARIGDQ